MKRIFSKGLIAVLVFSLLAAVVPTMAFGAAAGVVIDNCDTKKNFAARLKPEVDTKDKKEGKACIKATHSGASEYFQIVFPAKDTKVTEKTGKLEFWLYVSDFSKFDTEGQIEISSSGASDKDEYNWVLPKLKLKNGWNKLILPFSKAGKMGKPNLKAINYFRLYQFTKGDVTLKIDNIVVK